MIRFNEKMAGKLYRTNSNQCMDISGHILWDRFTYSVMYRLARMAGCTAESGGSDKE